MQINKNCIHAGLLRSMFSKMLRNIITYAHNVHIHSDTVTKCNGMAWYGDVTVEYSYWIHCIHFIPYQIWVRQQYTYDVCLSPSCVCVSSFVHVIRAIANSICTQIFWQNTHYDARSTHRQCSLFNECDCSKQYTDNLIKRFLSCFAFFPSPCLRGFWSCIYLRADFNFEIYSVWFCVSDTLLWFKLNRIFDLLNKRWF